MTADPIIKPQPNGTLEAHKSAQTGIVCPGCGNRFVPTRPNQKHCRHSCRSRASERRRVEPRLPWEPVYDLPVLVFMKPLSRVVAEYLLARLGRWVSMQELAKVGGTGGWRTRVSEVRAALEPCGYVLENQQGQVETPDGPRRTSEYRLTVQP